jgi:type I restriction enzyme S subunit
VTTLQQNTHGAVFDTITRQTFETVSCLKPTLPLLDVFEATVAPLMVTMRSNLIERNVLVTLRDTLLPKLLSGELPVAAFSL